jgi:hypothetical protein
MPNIVIFLKKKFWRVAQIIEIIVFFAVSSLLYSKSTKVAAIFIKEATI